MKIFFGIFRENFGWLWGCSSRVPSFILIEDLTNFSLLKSKQPYQGWIENKNFFINRTYQVFIKNFSKSHKHVPLNVSQKNWLCNRKSYAWYVCITHHKVDGIRKPWKISYIIDSCFLRESFDIKKGNKKKSKCFIVW